MFQSLLLAYWLPVYRSLPCRICALHPFCQVRTSNLGLG